MSTYYKNYIWSQGIPYGTEKTDCHADCCYKIVADPYRKRISVEEYRLGVFSRLIYDSVWLDFRHLRPGAHQAWQRAIVSSSDTLPVKAAIRDQDDRLVWFESYYFEGSCCRKSLTHACHGEYLAKQLLFYRHLGDPFNGVVLFDSNDSPVMYKGYEVDDESLEFTNLIEEHWDMINNDPRRRWPEHLLMASEQGPGQPIEQYS